jgi:hypothetical protein
MPSKKNNKKKIEAISSSKHEAFLPILVLTFLMWFFYRSVFHFPVWFDETVGKLVFFALPVLLYVSISGNKEIFETLSFKKIKPGLLLGLAIGGIFGFSGALLGALNRGGSVALVPYYFADWFWKEMFLAIMTGFWETLFFYSFVMIIIDSKFSHFSLLKRVILVALIFLIFHLPNIFARFSLSEVILQIMLIFAFACGQALIFYKRRNAYLLILVQAIWGMVLLIHF